MRISDGKGRGYEAQVGSNNRLWTQTIQESEELHAIEEGNGYNINTGSITFSAAGTFLYVKNTGDDDIVVAAIAVGAGSGTTSDIGEITVISNPTGGDLISDATAVDINVNRNVGSSKTLSATVYKGKSAGTITGGSDAILFYHGTSSRLFGTINLTIPKGKSIAVKYDPKLSSGSIKAYCALVVYTKSQEIEG